MGWKLNLHGVFLGKTYMFSLTQYSNVKEIFPHLWNVCNIFPLHIIKIWK